MACAVLMVFVVADRTVMVALAVVVFVQAEGAVAVEVFEVAVEREGGADEGEFVGGAGAEGGGGGKRHDRSPEFHGHAPARPARAIMLDPRERVEGVTGRQPLFFRRQTGLAPRLHAAVEGAGVPEAEGAEGCGGEGGDLAEVADRDDAHGGIGESLVDAQF